MYDEYEVEYHLTRSGWVRGTESYFGKIETTIPPPLDRVETCVEHVKQSSEWSPEDVEWNKIWHARDATEDELGTLYAKYGSRPKQQTVDDLLNHYDALKRRPG